MAGSDAAHTLHSILLKDNQNTDKAKKPEKSLPTASMRRRSTLSIPPAPPSSPPMQHTVQALAYPSVHPSPPPAKLVPWVTRGNSTTANARANSGPIGGEMESSARRTSSTTTTPQHDPNPHYTRRSTTSSGSSNSSSTLSLISLMSAPTTPPHPPSPTTPPPRPLNPPSQTQIQTPNHKTPPEQPKPTPPPSSNQAAPPASPEHVATRTEHRSIWDPADSEWDSTLSSASITSTFTRSFHGPVDCALSGPAAEATALRRWGGTVRDTWRAVWSASAIECSGGGGDDDGGAMQPRQQSEVEHEQDGEPTQEQNLRQDLETLQNTYHSNPNGDLHDHITSLCFLPGSKYFGAPITTPSPRTMHILNLDAYFASPRPPLLQTANPRLSTAIATILSHTSHACITAFLDPRTEEFAYRREMERNKAGLILVVRRQGNSVIAGAYRNFGFQLQWVAYVKSVVGVTGQWYEVYAALGPGYTQIKDGVVAWDEFWPDGEEGGGEQGYRREDGAGPRRLALAGPEKKAGVEMGGVSPVEPKFMLYQSRVLARALLWDIWVRFDAMSECRATWEADGLVTEVRMQRALLGFSAEDEE